jgi:hypothetical protein
MDDVQAIEGPWEFTSASGIEGFFVSFGSFLDDRSGQMGINSQGVDIRVYRRKQGVELKGYLFPETRAGHRSRLMASISLFASMDILRLDHLTLTFVSTLTRGAGPEDGRARPTPAK